MRSILALGVICLLLVVLVSSTAQPDDRPAAGGPAPTTRVTIAPPTTFITQPLRDDGYPDYIAALNEVISAGVTLENNAAIPLLRAFGPAMLLDDTRPTFFAMLGIDPLPLEGDYLTDFEAYREQALAQAKEADDGNVVDPQHRQRLDEAYNQALERPWGADEFPVLAAWIESNAEPLQRIHEASRRSRYYAPLIAGSGSGDAMVMSILLPVLQELRDAARLLKIRAMLRIHEGKLEAAWEDLFAIHRLSRLAGQDPTLIGALVAIAIDSVAIQGDTALAADPRLQEPLARTMLSNLKTLASPASVVEKLNTAERFMYLDSVCAVASGRVGLSELAGDGSGEAFGWIARFASAVLVNWDVSLRMGNQWYDRLVAAANLPTHAQRNEAFAEINADTRKLSAELRTTKTALYGLLAPRAVISRQLGNVFVSLLLPAVSSAMDAENRSTALTRLNTLSLALTVYRTEHGDYPESLSELENEFDDLPTDPFSGETFRYRREDDGFVIYSVGPNLRDNDGKVYYLDETPEGRGANRQEWDDFRIRFPAEPEE